MRECDVYFGMPVWYKKDGKVFYGYVKRPWTEKYTFGTFLIHRGDYGVHALNMQYRFSDIHIVHYKELHRIQGKKRNFS